VRASAFALVAWSVLSGLGCDAPGAGASCAGAADCVGTVCALDRCRTHCEVAADCPGGLRCLFDPVGLGVCAVDEDHCDTDPDCPDGLVCGSDHLCLNACTARIDCPIDEICVPPGASRRVCRPMGSPSNPGIPVHDPITGLAAGRGVACAIRQSEVWCWGRGRRPARVGVSASRVAVAGSRAFAITTDGHLVTWDAPDGAPRLVPLGAAVPFLGDVVCGAGATFVIGLDGSVVAFGANDFAQITQPASTSLAPTLVGRMFGGDVRPLTGLATAGAHACAFGLDPALLGDTGVVTCWGSNLHGESGAPPSRHVEAHTRVLSPAFPVAQVMAADTATCALASGEVWCWGDRSRLGAGTQALAGCGGSCSIAPVRAHLPAGVGILLGHADGTTLCAQIGPDGSVWCWGDNSGGALGRAQPETVLEPAVVPELRQANLITLGVGFACALIDGAVRCGGSNTQGELGRGTVSDREAYAPIVFAP
jgi:alpha-tubulin suppressor-like RCC1 family protein